jgi:hypothetical protein
MAERDTLAEIAEQLALAMQPLVDAVQSPAALRDFLEELGWDFAAVPASLNSLAAPASQVYTLSASTEQVEGGQLGSLLSSVKVAFEAISQLGSAAGLANDFKDQFPRQLVDYLLCEYLLGQQPRIGYLLLALGVIRLDEKPAAPPRPAYLHRSVAFEDFGALVNDPLVFFKNAYRWGDSGFDGQKMIDAFEGLFTAWDLKVYESELDANTLDQLNAGALDPNSTDASNLRLALFEHSLDAASFGAGVGLFLLPETAAAKPGFALMPYASGELDEDIELSEELTLGFKGGIDLTGGVGALVRPNQDVQFFAGFQSGTPSAISGNLSVSLTRAREGTPFVLIGNAAASNLQLGGVSTLGGTRFHSGGKFEVFTEFALQAGKIVVKAGPDEQDGFLARLLPPEGFQVPFDLTVGFSTQQGLYFGGSGGLEIALPAHVQLGPIEIVSALLAVKFRPPAGAEPAAIPVDLAATIKGDLAVLKATVENIGLRANFTFPSDRKGNLGPANLALGFRPPNGVGLVVDAGVVKGGGYLFFDLDKGEYAGALELTFSGFLSLKAIGLINTRMPGGQSGFSLLIIITAEFMPGFQLGFGFVLAGVGGLLGLNRAMLLDPLAQGVRTGAVNNILFPTNVVENAPRILSDLRAIFPPFEGKFLIGPMAKLGWGSPTLISVSLGIVIEIPGNVVILGRLRLNLPTENAPLVLLQVTFIGAIEFDKRRIWFFASLFESRVLFITLDGEMGLLMDFSDNPNFVLSVGGFHPRYKAPALPFPSPRRISLSIIDESFARVRVEGYFAVTSNSVQFGSRTEMFFGFDALSVEGHLGFDALLQFSPLYFIVEVSCGFGVKVFGIGVFGVHLRGSLEGPAPWRVRGSAEISLLFFSIDVDVDVTFGERNNDTLPPVLVMPLLRAEFDKPANWVASLPPSGQLLVSLRKLGEADGLVLHPVGVLRVSQRALPLNLEFQKVGNQKNSDVNKLSVEVEATGLQVAATARESFARAQYQEMDDAAKLSQPPFEKLDGGIDIAPDGASWAVGPGSQRSVRYETIIVDTLFERFVLKLFPFFAGLFEHFRAGSAIKRSGLSQAQERRRRPFADKVDLPGDRYVLASSADNRAMQGEASVFASFAEAQMHMNDALRADPTLVDSIHVIPAAEVQA